MNFGLKTYLAEEARRYNVVLVKKKIFLNEFDGGNKYEWSTTSNNAVVTFWPGDVMIGLKQEGGHLKWTTVVDKDGRIRGSHAVSGSKSEADFKPSEYDELLKLGALKGMA